MLSQTRHRNNHLKLLTSDVTGSYSVKVRRDTELFIHQRFAEAHNADIQQFMPILLCLKDKFLSPRAALGLRPAQGDKLFLENYFSEPIENVISGKVSRSIQRSEIIEAGNLAIGEKGDARALIIAMTAFLSAANIKWVCFTIGPVLINSFTRLGIPLIELGPARLDMLPREEQSAWGDYYDQKPKVMAGCLSDARDFLLRHSLQERVMSDLWQQAQQIGAKAA